MPAEQLPDEDERRLLDMFEQSSLHDYPNPDRIGCPGQDFLRQLAFNRQSISVSDPRLDHITHCSPCYRDYVDFRAQARRRIRPTHKAAIAAIVLVALGFGFYLASRQSGKPRWTANNLLYQSANLNLKDVVLPRGAPVTESGPSAETQQLPRQRLSLTITLPLASPVGSYDVQVLREIDKPLAAASGQARLENGLTLLIVKLDLSALPPGKYLVGIRRESRDWVYHSLTLA